MDLFNSLLLDLILLSAPLVIYALYIIYTKTIDIKKNSLILDLAIITSYYLVTKFGYLNYNNNPILILDLLLIIAYLKKSIVSITFLNVLLIITQGASMFLILEYSIYLILFILLNYKKIKEKNFINIYILIKTIFYMYNIYPAWNILSIIVLFIFILVVKLFIYFIKKTNDTLYLYQEINNIEKEKRIIESLFKITHEIKNPIAVCKGYLDMYDVNNLEHSKKYIPILKSEINRVLILLKDFLSITKIKIKKEEMDLNMLLEDTVNCLNPLINQKDIKFNISITDDEIYIKGDYNRLKQALINILKNSKEAIGNKGEIKLYSKMNKKNIQIIIEDNGCGMNKESLIKLKEAFFTTKRNGTGLGVYLVNEIITAHGGNLQYFSKEGWGTKTIITLPI